MASMSKPRRPQPAKLVISALLADKTLLPEVLRQLESEFGNIALESAWMDFGFTDYYRSEMGGALVRKMLAFGPLVEQAHLSRIKLATNRMEAAFAVEDRRRVNLDPGYLLLERFVLATGKNFSHLIYIGESIYADLTLIFQKGGFQPLPWTYPDYAEPEMHTFLLQVRQSYSRELRDRIS
jgi:hypothetical protein